MSNDHFNFVFIFSIDQIRRWLEEVGAVFHSFLISCKEGSMEDQVDLPSQRNVESEGGSRDDFLDFEWTSSLHLEFLGSSHMKVGRFQPYLFSDLPQGELRCNLFLHFLLGHLVGSSGVIMSGGEI